MVMHRKLKGLLKESPAGVKKRALYRHYNRQSADLHDPVLAKAVDSGLIVLRDGLLHDGIVAEATHGAGDVEEGIVEPQLGHDKSVFLPPQSPPSHEISESTALSQSAGSDSSCDDGEPCLDAPDRAMLAMVQEEKRRLEQEQAAKSAQHLSEPKPKFSIDAPPPSEGTSSDDIPQPPLPSGEW